MTCGRPLRAVVLLLGCLAQACLPEQRTPVARDEGGDGDDDGADGGDATGQPLSDDVVRLEGAVAATDDAPAVDGMFDHDIPRGFDWRDLGNVGVDADGRTGTIAIDVDARITGITVIVIGQPDGAVLLTSATDAHGSAVVIDDDAPDATEKVRVLSRGFPSQFLSPSRELVSRHVGAFALPSTPDVALGTGTWRIRVGHFRLDVAADGRVTPSPYARPVRVIAVLRTASIDGVHVGLSLRLSGSAGLQSDSAPSDARLARALAVLGSTWAEAGITIDDIAYRDITLPSTTIELQAPLCEGGALDDVVARDVDPLRVNITFVDRFACGSVGPFVYGMTTGIPGTPLLGRSIHAGVAVATSFLDEDPDGFALALAHEASHLLGLFHTEENTAFGAPIFDPIDDTPDDDDGARDNLMYFDLARQRAHALSPSQAIMLRRSPWARPAP